MTIIFLNINLLINIILNIDQYLRASWINAVHALLEHLEPREARILCARFGFDDQPKSLAAIGREIGIFSRAGTPDRNARL